MVFKWNETSVKRKDVLKAIGREPLFGHPTNSKCTTHWFTFMKIPESSLNLKTMEAGNEKRNS